MEHENCIHGPKTKFISEHIFLFVIFGFLSEILLWKKLKLLKNPLSEKDGITSFASPKKSKLVMVSNLVSKLN